jgi:hypothetical protein
VAESIGEPVAEKCYHRFDDRAALVSLREDLEEKLNDVRWADGFGRIRFLVLDSV